MGYLRNGVYTRTCQRSRCNERVYLKIGIKYKIILCPDCRLTEWSNE
jgi:hypothetical protein